MESPASYQRFFAELKRRRVFRVMAVYGIVGFVVLQVVDLAVPALLLPEWTYRLAALLLLLGFPVAIVLTWAFEVTPEGVRRTADADAGEIDAIATAPPGQRWPVGLAAAAGTALLLGGAWWVLDGPGTGAARSVTSPGDPVESIAVLPFEDLSPDGDRAYFGDGLAEELLDALAQVEGLTVRARTSSFRFRGADVDIPEVADQLGVQTVLEGSVRYGGDRVRITAQLVNAAGFHLWSDSYDRSIDDMEDLIGVQEEIARSIVKALSLAPETDDGEAMETLIAQGTDDLEAYNAFLRGRELMARRTPQSLAAAAEQFELAVALDPEYVRAWAHLGMTNNLRIGWSFTTDSAVEARGREATERALALDPENAQALTSRGYIHVWIQPDLAAAQRDFARAIESNPRYPTAWHWRGESLGDYGDPKAGIPYLETARDLDPLSPIILTDLADTYDAAGRYADADSLVAHVLELEPDFLPAWLSRADYRLRNGEPHGRVRDLRHIESLNPELRWIDFEMAASHAETGDFEEAVERFRRQLPAELSVVPDSLELGFFFTLPTILPALQETEGPAGVRRFADMYVPWLSSRNSVSGSRTGHRWRVAATYVRGYAAAVAGNEAVARRAVDELQERAEEIRRQEGEETFREDASDWALWFSMSISATLGDVDAFLEAVDSLSAFAATPYMRFWLDHGPSLRRVRDDPRIREFVDGLPPYTDFEWPDP